MPGLGIWYLHSPAARFIPNSNKMCVIERAEQTNDLCCHISGTTDCSCCTGVKRPQDLRDLRKCMLYRCSLFCGQVFTVSFILSWKCKVYAGCIARICKVDQRIAQAIDSLGRCWILDPCLCQVKILALGIPQIADWQSGAGNPTVPSEFELLIVADLEKLNSPSNSAGR
jgi:hypothetical protein